jgi:hypothetical protein
MKRPLQGRSVAANGGERLSLPDKRRTLLLSFAKLRKLHAEAIIVGPPFAAIERFCPRESPALFEFDIGADATMKFFKQNGEFRYEATVLEGSQLAK